MKFDTGVNNRYFTWRPIYILSHLPHPFLEWEIFQKKVVEKIKTHFKFNDFPFFFGKSWRLWGNVEKYDTARQATDGNKPHAHFVLDD